MRNLSLAFVLSAVGFVLSACSQSSPCKPNSVTATLSCPEGFAAGDFEISVSRNGGEFKKLDLLAAVCPETKLRLDINAYAVGQSLAIEIVAVDKSGKRFPPTRATAILEKSCTTIAVDNFTGDKLENPQSGEDGGAIDASVDSATDELCAPNEKRCLGDSTQSCVDAKWVTEKDCTGLCQDGLCKGDCKPGTTTCQASSVVTCKSDGTRSIGEPCANLCKDGACGGDCQPRSRRCTGNTPELCDETGTWKPETACTNSCIDGFCGGCAKNETMCNGDTPYVCNDAGKWIKGDTCPFFCSATLKKCDGVCKPGMVQCGADQKVDTCDDKGQWKPADTACANVCVNGACGGECKPGAKVCGAGNTSRTCGADGKFTVGTKCQYVCNNGSCIGSCTPNDIQCSGNGTALQLCSADGAWVDSMSCGSGCLSKSCNECSPGTPRCTGAGNNDAQTCGADGKWGTAMTCASGCSQGGCNSCSGGTRCTSMGDLQACVGGAWASPTTCGGKGCLANKCNACIPKTQRCANGVAFTCKDDGTSEDQKICTFGCGSSGMICNECKPDTNRCSTDLATAYKCNAAGTSEASSPCGALLCNSGTKVCNFCTPGEKGCSGTRKRQCAADGSMWIDATDCGAPSCNGSTGECFACAKDARRCMGGNTEQCAANQSTWELVQTCQQPAGCNPDLLKCNSCQPSTARCKSGTETATCRSDGTGEIVGVCPSNQYCLSSAPGAASCVACPAAPAACTGVGSFCSGTSVISCGPNPNGCLVQTGSTVDCNASKPDDSTATCSGGTCGHTCNAATACVTGAKKCGANGGVQTCGAGTCPSWAAELPCPARQICSDAAQFSCVPKPCTLDGECIANEFCSATKKCVSRVVDAGSSSSTGSFNCSVHYDGAVRCWGTNTDGQLGDGSFDTRLTPGEVKGLGAKAIRIRTSYDVACAQLENNELKCWGNNVNGQLAITLSTANSAVPVKVALPANEDIKDFGVSFQHTCVLFNSGLVYCWGKSSFGEVGPGLAAPGITRTPVLVTGIGPADVLGVGGQQTCVRQTDNKLMCWGANPNGQLGRSTPSGSTSNPPGAVIQEISGTFSTTPFDATNVVKIRVSGQTSCALTSLNQVFCWGQNFYGQRGIGDSAFGYGVNSAISFNGVTTGFNDVAVGSGHTCARVAQTSEVVCSGNNSSSQVSVLSALAQTNVPIKSVNLKVYSVYANGSSTCGIAWTGGLQCWGLNNGAIGTPNSTSPKVITTPTQPAW